MKDRWSGYVIDGGKQNIDRLKSSYFYWQHSLNCQQSFITKENVNELLEHSGFDKELGILSVDIDGVDYFVLKELKDWQPAIIIVEYNGVFGCDEPLTVPYDPNFVRAKAHYSNIYYGANLPAFRHLLTPQGYSLVAINDAGSNAFFVKRELLNDRVKEVDLEVAYKDSNFRESRSEDGKLKFLSGMNRRKLIEDLPLLNVETGELTTVGNIKAQ